MKKFIFNVISIICLGITAFPQSIPTDSLYLGQTPPGNTPVIFNLPVATGLRPVERITINSDGTEIYYGEQDQWPPTVKRIKYFKYENNHWQGPFVVFEGFVCPALSVNDSIMYMQKDVNGVARTYYSTRNAGGWSVPVRLLSTTLQVHYFQKTNPGNYYLASTVPDLSNSNICRLVIPGSDTVIRSLGLPVNTPNIENDFFIARDESFLIVFRLIAPFDLFISYKKGDGSWTNPKSIGVNINTSIYDCSPFVTLDKKYLFFTRGGAAMPSYNTYWVKVDQLIDSLKYTNYSPYVKNSLPDQVAIRGQLYSYTVPDTTFFDDDGNNTLSFSASLSNGNPLPSWLAFDSLTSTFSGTPGSLQTLNIRVTATDTAGASVSAGFKLDVHPPDGIEPKNGPDHILKLFPNPADGLVILSLNAYGDKPALAEIYNQEGAMIQTISFTGKTEIDLSSKPKGIYMVKVFVNDEIQIEKLCIQ